LTGASGMPTVKKPVHQVTVAVTGKFHDGYNPLTGKPFKLVYQRVRKGLGNIENRGRMDLQIRVQVSIRDKQSPTQLQSRKRLAAATAAYKHLDNTAKTDWCRQAAKLRMTGFNLYIRRYCKAHPLTEF
ncbi:hypothetical protein, partial [Methylobacter psychrophilus]|uniref:hypothetical protein n=1 Tax=Methylobacter psychrophilus TaxID=96941 RepID=UPI0021D4A254